ncbi:MAG: hypothetical protein JKY32_05185 [Rhizobiales bacterium]|nr:hypothetical protein [Hyphomicrobiales bacterium]
MKTLKWMDEAQTMALLDDGEGKRTSIPTDHPMLAELLATGLVIADYTAPVELPARLPKLLVIDRLQTAGKFGAALAALNANPLNYERWSASNTVDVEDVDVLGLLAAINADVNEILAPE